MSKDIKTTQMSFFMDPTSQSHLLNLQECIDLINLLTEQGKKEYGSREPLEDAFYRYWRGKIFLQHHHDKVYSDNLDNYKGQFIKHGIRLISSLNQGTQNQSFLLRQILSENYDLFPKALEIFLEDQFHSISIPEFRAFFEAGRPRIGFLWLWDICLNLKNNVSNLWWINRVKKFFNEAGDWMYSQDNLELVFKPSTISRPRRNAWGRDMESKDRFTSLPTAPYTPWLWLLSWQREEMGFKTHSGHVSKMIHFLKLLKKAQVFSKPGRMLYYFVLSELHLHPRRTGGPNLQTAQKLVDNIAAEHPLGLFDPMLPARVLDHCAEMRLKSFQTLLLTSPPSTTAWQPEFLRAAPKILPALHALLHRDNHSEDKLSDDVLNNEPATGFIHEEYLKVILQKFNPNIFAEQKGEELPKKESVQGQVCFTIFPRLIEYFMRADKVLADQIDLMTTKNQATHVLLTTMQATLEKYRLELAELFYNEMRNLLSLKPETITRTLPEEEDLVKKKILAHALNWPVAILQQEETRLTQRMAANPGKVLHHEEIAVLQGGRQQITELTHRYLNTHIQPAEYTMQVQAVLKRVEQKGGAHNNFLTIVARVAANIMIFLSAGLLHSFFKKQIQKTRAAPVPGYGQYFFSVKSRRAETIHCANLGIGYGKA